MGGLLACTHHPNRGSHERVRRQSAGPPQTCGVNHFPLLIHQPPKRRPRQTAGFTILELLVIMAILGILGALLGPQIASWSQKNRSENYVTSFTSSLASARASSLSTGLIRRVIIDNASTYHVERRNKDLVWETVENPLTNPQPVFTLTTPSLGRCLQFDTRGVMKAFSDTACTNVTTTTSYAITASSTTQLTLTALGMVNRS